MIADAIGYEAFFLAAKASKLDLKIITDRLKQTVETAYTNAVRYAARRMIGRSWGSAWGSTSSIKTPPLDVYIGEDEFLAASWNPLSVRQFKKQRETYGASLTRPRFFLDTGALRSELLSMARAMVKRTGVVKVEVKDEVTGGVRKPLRTTKIVPVADLKLKLLPNVYPSQLPGIRSGIISDHNIGMGFEKSLGLSEETIRKLRGPIVPGQDADLYHRPLLQPVFTYWTLYQIPGVVAEALNRGLIGQKKSVGPS